MKIKNKGRFYTVLFIFSLLMIFTFLTSTTIGKRQFKTYEHKVQNNDTIWNIADNICKSDSSLNIQNVILEIKDINNLNTSDIYVGQTLNIPIY